MVSAPVTRQPTPRVPPRAGRPSPALCGLLALAFLLLAAAAAQALEVLVEPNPVPAQEPFRLTFTTHEAVDEEPDFSPLERDFEILGRARSTNLSFVDGNLQRTTVWVLSLMPRRNGTLPIPAIAFGDEQASAPTQVQVEAPDASAASAPPTLLLEVEAEPRSVYVQQQVLVTVRLLRRVTLGDASLSHPSTSGGDAVVEQLGKDRNYDLERDGQRWTVVERRFSVHPQVSGTLTIDPFVFEGQVIEGSSSYRDPFGSRVFDRRLSSEPVRIEVRPAAGEAGAGPWLPSTGVRLAEVWSDDSPVFVVGQPVTRTLALMAEGLTASQLPELSSPLPPGLKEYPEAPSLSDQRDDKGVVGVRQEKRVLVASEPGRYTLPALEVTWWNLATDRLETARLPERQIEVKPSSAIQAGPPEEAAASTPAPAAADAQPLPVPAPPTAGAQSGPAFWPLLTALATLGWLATVVAWWASRRGAAARRSLPGQASAPAPYRAEALRAACLAGDAGGAQQALLRWARHHWPQGAPASLGELARRVPGPLADALLELNRTLYQGSADPWQGGPGLWEAFRAFSPDSAAATPARPSALQPLNPA